MPSSRSPKAPIIGEAPPSVATRTATDKPGPRAQRTIERILTATREVFLTRGYAGTTIDDIAKVAALSRASFYTYFPSKREVLLAVGATAADDAAAHVARLADHSHSRVALRRWCDEYMALLDIHGSFVFGWTQAANEDEEIRIAGMRRHYGLCRQLGDAILASTGKQTSEPGPLGLIVFSMFERAWRYCELYDDKVDRDAVTAQIAVAIWGLARQPGN